MASKSEKRKQQKKVERKKRLEKERNLRANGARMRYTLECRLTKDGAWRPMKRFKDGAAVQKHIDETEAIRKRGDTDIIEGRVIDNNSFGRIVARIPGFIKEAGPSMLEAARDSISDIVSQKIAQVVSNGNEAIESMSKISENLPKAVENAE